MFITCGPLFMIRILILDSYYLVSKFTPGLVPAQDGILPGYL